MFFVSTRNSKVLSKFKDAVTHVMAEHQGGIFTPSFITPLDFDTLYVMSKKSYKDILLELILNFCDNSIPRDTLKQLIDESFKDFGKYFGAKEKKNNLRGDNVFSLQTLEEGIEVANLTYGPTGCCKDYGYCFAAEIVNYFAQKKGETKTIIDISGGSSGPSVAYAVRNKSNLKAFTLLQANKKQSVKALIYKANKEADNIGYATVNADDNFINKMRYDIYNNQSLRELLNMTFINELNLLCIFAYIPAFFKAYERCNNKPFVVSLPSGNISLGFAAFLAKKLGLPIRKIILATEKNNFLYEVQHSKVAINNPELEDGLTSLHNNIPTNFERILFILFENNQGSVKRAMQELESNGRYKINDYLLSKFVEHFFVAKCDNQFTMRNTVSNAIREKELYVEQHFALSKMGLDVAVSEISSDIANTPVVLFNTLDYRRNIDFVNSSLGYDVERVEYPWTPDDVKSFAPTEIQKDETVLLRYIVDALEHKEKLKANSQQPEEGK